MCSPVVRRTAARVACETLDTMGNVCGVYCARWVGEDEHGDREYTLDCLDKDGQRYIVNHSDLLGAVCELAVLGLPKHLGGDGSYL